MPVDVLPTVPAEVLPTIPAEVPPTVPAAALPPEPADAQPAAKPCLSPSVRAPTVPPAALPPEPAILPQIDCAAVPTVAAAATSTPCVAAASTPSVAAACALSILLMRQRPAVVAAAPSTTSVAAACAPSRVASIGERYSRNHLRCCPPLLTVTATDSPDIEWHEVNTQLEAMEVERNTTSIWSSSAPSGVSATRATLQYVSVDLSPPPPLRHRCRRFTVRSAVPPPRQRPTLPPVAR